jgi:hypothetical protein
MWWTFLEFDLLLLSSNYNFAFICRPISLLACTQFPFCFRPVNEHGQITHIPFGFFLMFLILSHLKHPPGKNPHCQLQDAGLALQKNSCPCLQ